MSIEKARSDANHCFVCGPGNPQGMQIQFRIEDGMCKGEYSPPKHLCGFDGITHGGILFSLLDDVMANWLFLQNEPAYTARCEIRYREPAKIGTNLLLEGEMVSRKKRFVNLIGRILAADDRRLIADANATFMVLK